MSRDTSRDRTPEPERPEATRTAPADAGSTRLEERDAEPRKRHGDALVDGTGNRHGVDQRTERPET